jgi:hypothetical protein
MGLVKRQEPFFSTVGCGAALVLVVGVAVAVLVSGGELLNPGRLSAQVQPVSGNKAAGGFTSHAAFEQDCLQCHAPFRGVEAARCERCHTAVAGERAGSTGVHGNSKVANVARCQTCHLEHQGRDYNLLAAARLNFDHQVYRFSLIRHVRDYAQAPLAEACQRCHSDANAAASIAECTACHATHDQAFMNDHTTAFGQDCLACHDGLDKMKGFDHGRVQFALTSRHLQVACASCHKASVAVKDTPAECVGCHAEPPTHTGMFGTGCTTCHTPAAWAPAKVKGVLFDHKSTGFALTSHVKDFDASPFLCTKCHPSAITLASTRATTLDQQVCITCHTRADSAFMAGHTQKYGVNCVSCHDGAHNMDGFEHKNVFVLDGKHAQLTCDQCHPQQTFKGTPKACVGCHAEPKVHQGLFGTDCIACHTSTGWTPARLNRHTFPLDHGGQGEVPCATCHPDTYPAYTCYGCHDHVQDEITKTHAEKKIQGNALNACVACHATGKNSTDRP